MKARLLLIQLCNRLQDPSRFEKPHQASFDGELEDEIAERHDRKMHILNSPLLFVCDIKYRHSSHLRKRKCNFLENFAALLDNEVDVVKLLGGETVVLPKF